MKSILNYMKAAAVGALLIQPLGAAPASAANTSAGLYYETCGTGPAYVVLLHDAYLHSQAYDDVWTALCKAEGVTIVRYDRRGYGQSPAATFEYSETNDLAVLLRDIGADKATVVASSTSTQIPVEIALRLPQLLEGLVLVSPSVGPYRYSGAYVDRRRALLSPLQENNIPEVIKRLAADPYVVSPANDEARDRMVKILEDNQQNLAIRQWRQPPSFIYDRLNEVKKPTLILIGENDDPENIRHAEDVGKAIPNAIRVSVNDTAQLMYLEQPDLFAKHVLDFIAEQ